MSAPPICLLCNEIVTFCQCERSVTTLQEYLAHIGSQGGKKGGKAKVRGDSSYYKRISAKAAKARKAKTECPLKRGERMVPCPICDNDASRCPIGNRAADGDGAATDEATGAT
jgi:hypothetical protein